MLRILPIVASCVLITTAASAESITTKSLMSVARSHAAVAGNDPACGNADLGAVRAGQVSAALGASADQYIDLPAFTPDLALLGNGAERPVAQAGSGAAVCVLQCIEVPAAAQATYRVGLTQLDPGGDEDEGVQMSTADADPVRSNGQYTRASVTNASVAASSTGKGKLFCAVAKNWSNSFARDFVIQATYAN